MFFSLPPLAPHNPHTLFYPSSIPHPPNSAPSQSNNPNHQSNPQNQTHPDQQPQQAPPPPPTALSVLYADEHAILVRKANIRRFGAKWLRPTGVGKTLQGMEDERIEREEAEMNAIRDHTDAQTLPDTASPPSTTGAPEHDLDEEVPDADDELETGWIEDDDDLDAALPLSDDEHGGTMAVDEDDMGIDTEGDGDYAQGRDLDDDIPEGMDADSYQHTDTEVEDESSFEGERQGVLSNSVWGSGGGSGIGPVGGNPGAGAGSVNLPVGASRGGRRSGGRLGGREN